MNNIEIIIQDGHTPTNIHLVFFRFKKNDLYYTDTILAWFDTETCVIKGLTYSVDITHFYNITEEEYFMQSVKWKSNIPLDVAIKVAKMSKEYFDNKSFNINEKIIFEY